MIPELGALGIAIYTSMVVLVVFRLRGVAKHIPREACNDSMVKDLVLLSHAALASLIAFLVCGVFISVLYYPHFWYLIGFTIALDYAKHDALKRYAS